MTGSIYVTAAWDGGRTQLNTDIPSLFFLDTNIDRNGARYESFYSNSVVWEADYFLSAKYVKIYIVVITLPFLCASGIASKQWFGDYIVSGLGWGNEFRAYDGISLEPHISITTQHYNSK